MKKNSSNQQVYVQIPVQELHAYQKGILGVLSKVELDDCDKTTKEDLKLVYKLLNHLQENEELTQTVNLKSKV